MLILDVPQSGSVAGVTSSRNRFGQYRRTRAIPVQPRTPKQTQTRSWLTVGSSAWRGVGDTTRTAWNDYAAQILRSGRLGSSYSPTGASLFTGSYALNPGATLSNPPPDLPTYVLDVSTVVYVDPTPGPEAIDVNIANTSPNNTVLVETSGPVSPGITSAAAVRRWRSLPENALNLRPNRYPMTASPIDVLAEYKFLFPSPASGNVIWFRFREVFWPGTGTAMISNQLFITFRLVIP